MADENICLTPALFQEILRKAISLDGANKKEETSVPGRRVGGWVALQLRKMGAEAQAIGMGKHKSHVNFAKPTHMASL